MSIESIATSNDRQASNDDYVSGGQRMLALISTAAAVAALHNANRFIKARMERVERIETTGPSKSYSALNTKGGSPADEAWGR